MTGFLLISASLGPFIPTAGEVLRDLDRLALGRLLAHRAFVVIAAPISSASESLAHTSRDTKSPISGVRTPARGYVTAWTVMSEVVSA